MADTPADDSYFGPELWQGVLAYQGVHGLAVNGGVDDPTLRMMQLEACDYPDHPTTETDPTEKWKLFGTWWGKKNLTYRFMSYSQNSGLSLYHQRFAFRSAFNTWAAQTQLTFTLITSGTPDIQIHFWPRGNPPAGWEDFGASSTVAYGLAPTPDRAKAALGYIGALFRIERSIAGAPRKKRERIGKKQSKPIVEQFFPWCDEQWPSLLEDTPIYDGVRYSRNQRVGLQRFLEDGRLPIHNNISELNLRRQAVGRKNWLFVGSDDGAAANASFTSLLASCRMHGVEPWSYLRDIFCQLPEWPAHRMLELSPLKWTNTSTGEQTQKLLAANPYRRITWSSPAGAPSSSLAGRQYAIWRTDTLNCNHARMTNLP